MASTGRAAIAARDAGVITRAIAGGGLQVSPPLVITRDQASTSSPPGCGRAWMPSDVSTVPFWRADHPGPGRPLERLPTRVDFAVVGAGYTGLNAAREIAATGASVLVLDAGPVGAGASSVNGGMVNYGLKAKTSKIYDMFGPALGREFSDTALSSIDLVSDLVTEHAIDCSFVRGGAAQLGYNDRDLHHFEAQAEWYLGKLDYPCDVVGPDRSGGSSTVRRSTPR